ncbi:hypothetical protein [Entomohabitans teleogrylli]|nr:hypothetical protein [Entomohabitans teleogrylli]
MKEKSVPKEIKPGYQPLLFIGMAGKYNGFSSGQLVYSLLKGARLCLQG